MTDNENSAQKNADIIIDSAHKTLPVLTGGAFLHFNNNISYSDIKEHMGLFGSTSPSFPILASLDYARDWCENYGKNEFGLTEQRTEALRNIIEKTGFFTVKGDLYDKTRITISVLNKNIDGFYLAHELEKEKIIPEMANKNNVVLLFSPFNDLNEYESVKSFFENNNFQSSDKKINCPEIPHTTFKVKIKTAFFEKKETVPIKKAVGRIAAEAVVPYPPGVPVIIPGELITEELTEYLHVYHNVDFLNVIL
jgi:arginine/lysine/ornithine decarboxylase